jgi:hypothetical protein
MQQFLRLAALSVVGVAVSTAASASEPAPMPRAVKDKPKLVGKWKLESFDGQDDDMKAMKALEMYLYFDFADDGSLTIGIDTTHANGKEMLAKSGQQLTWKCKYKVLSGEEIEVYDLPKEMQNGNGGPFGNKDKAKSKVTIKEDEMTMKDPDGKTAKLTRMK